MAEMVTLDMNTPSVQYLCRKDKRLAKIISMVGPISYVPHEQDPYSHMVHEIIEQMMSIKAGQKIYSRLENLCGGDVSPKVIRRLSYEELRSCGTSSAKVNCIQNLTNAVISGSIVFSEFKEMSDADIIKKLTSIKGIGPWTSKMYLIFILDRQDVLPYEDGAFLQAYRWLYKTDDVSVDSVEKRCKKWKPYSSVAARFMYRALDYGFTKNEFHLFKNNEVLSE